MIFHPYTGNILTVLQGYNSIVEHERANFGSIGPELSVTLEDGELSARQSFSASLTELDIRLSLLRSQVEPHLSLTLRFRQRKDGEQIERGTVGIRAEPRQDQNGWLLHWDVFATRTAPAKLPRGAERLTSRLRAQLRSKELEHIEKHRQLVSTIFCYAMRGDDSLSSLT